MEKVFYVRTSNCDGRPLHFVSLGLGMRLEEGLGMRLEGGLGMRTGNEAGGRPGNEIRRRSEYKT